MFGKKKKMTLQIKKIRGGGGYWVKCFVVIEPKYWNDNDTKT